MALEAKLKFSQGASTPPGGQALVAAAGGPDPVAIANTSASEVASWRIELLYGPIGSTLARDPGDPLLWAENPNDDTPSKSFAPEVGFDGECYRVRLRVWDGPNYSGSMDEDIRCVGVPRGSINAIFPPNQSDPLPLTDKDNELNFGGQVYHWSGDTAANSGGVMLLNPMLRELVDNLDAFLTHEADTANPHATDIENLGSGTLAELNDAVTDATLDDSGDPRTPTAHVTTHHSGGSDPLVHDSIAGSGTNSHAQIDTHIADTTNPHQTDVGNLGSGTLAELNNAITDATLDDSGDPRDPTAHATTHHSGGGDALAHDSIAGSGTNTHAQIDTHLGSTSNPHQTDVGNLGSGTLTELNSAITDATLDDSGDPRDPNAHASTHLSGAGDEVDGDKLDIDWNPSNYTPTSAPAEVDSVDQLTAHLAGIDAALAGVSFPGYEATLPVTCTAGVGSVGSNTTLNRSDHRHRVETATPIDLSWGSNQAGTSDSLARADHQHAVTAQVTPTACSALPGAEGTATTFVRGDHRHQISTYVSATSLACGDVAGAGSANSLSRGDHQHAMPGYTGSVTSVSAAAGTNGSDGPPARGNHSHTVLVAGVGLIKPGVAQLEGTSDNLARADHLHACNVENPTAAVDAGAGSVGSAETFNRGDHKHQVSTSVSAPADVDGTGNASAGAANTLARSDHKHQINWASGGLWPMTLVETAAPGSTPSSGTAYLWLDSTDHKLKIWFDNDTKVDLAQP
jgi:hypothetical protein